MHVDDFTITITINDGQVEVDGRDVMDQPMTDSEFWQHIPRAVGALHTLQNEILARRNEARKRST